MEGDPREFNQLPRVAQLQEWGWDLNPQLLTTDSISFKGSGLPRRPNRRSILVGGGGVDGKGSSPLAVEQSLLNWETHHGDNQVCRDATPSPCTLSSPPAGHPYGSLQQKPLQLFLSRDTFPYPSPAPSLNNSKH